jgi:hypothetical protein
VKVMSNLDLLRYLREYGLISFDEFTDRKGYADVVSVYDSDGWNSVIIYFDEKGNVLE